MACLSSAKATFTPRNWLTDQALQIELRGIVVKTANKTQAKINGENHDIWPSLLRTHGPFQPVPWLYGHHDRGDYYRGYYVGDLGGGPATRLRSGVATTMMAVVLRGYKLNPPLARENFKPPCIIRTS